MLTDKHISTGIAEILVQLLCLLVYGDFKEHGCNYRHHPTEFKYRY